jgi:ABC-type multidrug transport system fused ATPase/permease subunit
VTRWVNAADLIRRLGRNGQSGFDTILNEQGKNLSMGERQLILFARALYHDPAILILDEATSAIDSHTEHLVQKALDHLLAGRTSLVIAHRLSTIEKADRILLIDRGQIAEAGTHAELMAHGGQYARFFTYQQMQWEATG